MMMMMMMMIHILHWYSFVFIKNVKKWCNHEICTANQWATESVQCSAVNGVSIDISNFAVVTGSSIFA
jgi:hypothetical protein